MTLNQFLKEYSNFREDFKELEIVIECPNGLLVEPKIKQYHEDMYDVFSGKLPEKLIITWR